MDSVSDSFGDSNADAASSSDDSGHEAVIEINRQRVFSLADAQAVLPVVFRITKAYSHKVDALIERLEAANVSSANEALVSSIEEEVNELIQGWQAKVQMLGAVPKGLWLADFDAGDGYFCWKFPERSIEFWHTYNDGYSKRVKVSERDRSALRPLAQFAEKLRGKILSPLDLQVSKFTE